MPEKWTYKKFRVRSAGVKTDGETREGSRVFEYDALEADSIAASEAIL
jgi:hypothetical protein